SARLTGALRDARFIVVCCSQSAVESHWVGVEVTEFLKSHPREDVLACLVGPITTGPFTVPQAVQRIEVELKDDLFKPDLRGNPEGFKARERKSAIREALALLAPLVDLPGKEKLLDQRKKTLISGTALVLVLSSVGIGWKLWDNRPGSQINKLLAESSGLVR